LIRRGDILDAARLGVLAGQGHEKVKVFPKPGICISSVGDELIAGGETPTPGKIYDSNRITLSARALSLGARLVPSENMPDEPGAIAEMLLSFLEKSDFVISSGGVSVGEKDYMPRVGRDIGGEVIFRGITAKPGAPCTAFEKDGKTLLFLSGNPFAAFATFELLAAPVIKKLAGRNDPMPQKFAARMDDSYDKASEGRRFLRAYTENGKVRLPGKKHASGVLSSLIGCNCMIDIPAGTPGLKPGELVDIVMV
jgi:molybdopterin molybdotransferase